MSVSNLIIGKGDTKGRVPIHCDDDGNLYFTGSLPTPGGVVPTGIASVAKEASKVISAAPGVLFSLTVANTTSTDAFLLLFEAAALPADNTIPVDYAVIPAGWVGGFDYGSLGRDFTTGIVAAISSTLDKLTAVAGTDYLFSARYST